MLSQFMEALDMGSLELEVVSERRVWCFLVVQLFSEGPVIFLSSGPYSRIGKHCIRVLFSVSLVE